MGDNVYWSDGTTGWGSWTAPDAAGDLAQVLGVSRDGACRIIAQGTIEGFITSLDLSLVKPIWRRPR